MSALVVEASDDSTGITRETLKRESRKSAKNPRNAVEPAASATDMPFIWQPDPPVPFWEINQYVSWAHNPFQIWAVDYL
jgi:hypothetical protein